MTMQTEQTANKKMEAWKAVLLILLWILILGAVGTFIGNRYFWTDPEVQRFEGEVEHYRQLVESEPDNPAHYVALGFNLHRLGSLQGAITQFNNALAIDDNYFDAYLNLGYVYVSLEHWDDALQMFIKCVEISPQDYKGHFNAGIVYREMGMTQAAYENMETALLLRPAATDVLYHLALTSEGEGDREAAIHYLEQALAYDPRYAEALTLYNKLN